MGRIRKKAWMKTAHLFSGENNQFRMKFNRTKHEVLNAKVKGTKGNPILSKGAAYSKLKKQWEKNQVASKKSNRFVDKRLLHPSISAEDQATARLIREHKKKAKKNKFNLEDDIELTHKGKPLGDSGQWEDKGSDSEDEKILDDDFVNKAHFGGFASESNFETPKSHKEVIEQLINESKIKKQEKKSERERYISTQEMLDKEWKDIQGSINFTSSSARKANANVHEEKDLYDIIKSELKFETKSSTISHTKTPEQIAIEEEEKIIKGRKERLARMGSSSEKPDSHMSADALCDDFEVEPLFPQESENEDESEDANQLAEEMDTEDARSSIHSFPQSVENLKTLLSNCDAEQVFQEVDKVLKPAIYSKNENVKSELAEFFGVLLQYVLNCCKSNQPDAEKASCIITHLHSIASASPLKTAEKFIEFMDEEQRVFQECKGNINKYRANYPRLNLIKIIKFAGLIYSVSDRIHPIGRLAMKLMSDVLTSQFINTHSNIVSRLMVSKIWLGYISDSRRLVPEIVNFLEKVLKLTVPDKETRKCSEGMKRYTLVLNEKSVSEDIIKLDLHGKKKFSSEEEKASILFEVANQLNELAHLYDNLSTWKSYFAPTFNLCLQLPIKNYPTAVQDSIKAFTQLIQDKSVALKNLTFPKAKPKCLKMLEPAFESKFNKSMKNDINKKRQQLKEVQQKIRKEERSMLREIHKEAEVNAAEKLKKKLELDAERKRKVKEIYGQLSMQEGEFKKMMKKKS